MFVPYIYVGGGTWEPVIGQVDRVERLIGKPPVYSFRTTAGLTLGSTILMTMFHYSTAMGTGYLTPVDIGYVSSVKSEALQYVYEYEVDSFLTMLYDAGLEITQATRLSSLVSGAVSRINSSTGLGISYQPRFFEVNLFVEPKTANKFSVLLSKIFGNSVDYSFHFGTLELTGVSTYVGTITPILVAVKSNAMVDGYYDPFSPVTILDDSMDFDAVPTSIGSSGLLKRRRIKVATKPSRVSVIVWASPSETNCLGREYLEACVALDYKLHGDITVWKIAPDVPTSSGDNPTRYRVIARLCCRGEVGSEKVLGCDYSVDTKANEEKDRLVLTFRDETVWDGSYFLVVMDAVKVFYIEDDSVDSKQVETYVLEDYGDVNLFPEYPSGTYFLLSRDGDYIKSRDQRLYLAAKTNPLTGLGEMVMVPGRPFFKKYTLNPEGTSISGLLVNAVMERAMARHLVSRILFDGGRILYSFKPYEHYLSYVEAIEGLKKKYEMI